MHSSADANRHDCVASTWPLAYELNLHLLGYDPLPVNRLLMWIHVPYVIAIVTYALSKRMYHMEAAVVIADQNFGDTFSPGRLPLLPKGAELSSRGKVQAGRRGRLFNKSLPRGVAGSQAGNLETKGSKFRSEGQFGRFFGEWNHESRSFKLPRKVHSSRVISECAALSALSDVEGDCATGSREMLPLL